MACNAPFALAVPPLAAPLRASSPSGRKVRRMRRSIGFAIALLLAVPAFADDWKLIWSDEFDTPGLPDPAKWDYETGFIRNNESQFYTRERKENARVENGLLII